MDDDFGDSDTMEVEVAGGFEIVRELVPPPFLRSH